MTETLFDWADRREQDLRDVQKRIAHWEVNARTPRHFELLEKFRNAERVMLAGGECPMKRATLYTMLEALAIVGSQLGQPVGPSKTTNKSPAQLVADFAEKGIEIPPELHVASRSRAHELLGVIHGELDRAGISRGGTSQDIWREKGMT